MWTEAMVQILKRTKLQLQKDLSLQRKHLSWSFPCLLYLEKHSTFFMFFFNPLCYFLTLIIVSIQSVNSQSFPKSLKNRLIIIPLGLNMNHLFQKKIVKLAYFFHLRQPNSKQQNWIITHSTCLCIYWEILHNNNCASPLLSL